ncbi:MAG: peptide chain release factor 1 [Actinomyces sp.]|uniref:peptide chain release factor 1 n=1 Tax=unclassified Actinomyces TaxID=2609248 RepID=UPI0008A52E50|nr:MULTISPECIES: peptide chain release factor 1 [unclassified Actinomyces]MDK8533187.1 peptide chain release factor 1 [Gleimia europaea]OFJ61473.1 peptide chain release factor 1 [Actinomyces sp. HMSC075B09]MBS5825949.1 peptide chain release factor 1 [Actinomyces sp.]MBS6102429.1 peptide chain release factor 1 [Actinomyces sp.]MDU4831776.1 peptide chain release factor 1 [Actinomyces sp.]
MKSEDQVGQDYSHELQAVEPLLQEYREVELQLADPQVLGDRARSRKLAKRFSELGAVKAVADRFTQALGDFEAAQEMAELDDEFAAELPGMEQALEKAHDKLVRTLVPRDPSDADDVILEVKAGEGGEESALFAADLARMYTRYAETKGWKVKELSSTPTGLGGLKEISLSIASKGNVAPEDGVWANLKFEGGVHRVQRVPVTESQGRVHTSAAGVIVVPEVEDDDEEIEIDQNDLRIDVYRSSGPGGQSVNTTDSAVRITHIPSGIVVSMQNEKSQIQNREAAMRVLKARLIQKQREEREAEEAAVRQSQVRSMDRSERIRTYNFPENRIADHRTGYKAYNLSNVLDGDLGPVIDSAIVMDEQERMDAAGQSKE